MSRSRTWCFTINNFTDEDVENMLKLKENSKVTDIIAGKEHETEGTKHIQGFIRFKTLKSMGQVKIILGNRAHVEIARGTIEDNEKYCTKEGNVIVDHITTAINKKEINQKRSQTQKQHYRDLLDGICSMTEEEFADNFPQFYTLHKDLYLKHKADMTRNDEPYNGDLQEKNYWIYGPAGTGKSTLATEGLDADKIYRKNLNKWWDGFDKDEHDRVVIEDIDPKRAEALTAHLKIWGDRYSFLAECKGAHKFINPGDYQLFVTSNYTIEECFPNAADQEALLRRFTVIDFTGMDPKGSHKPKRTHYRELGENAKEKMKKMCNDRMKEKHEACVRAAERKKERKMKLIKKTKMENQKTLEEVNFISSDSEVEVDVTDSEYDDSIIEE